VLESTFRCPGVGASREKEIWALGYTRWHHLPRTGPLLSPKVDDRLRAAVDELAALAARGDAAGLARQIPIAEHWRIWARMPERACFLDVETDGRTLVVVGVLDAHGPATFLAGRNLADVPERLAASEVIVTFNGASFDLPALRAAFPGVRIPPVHVDLRHLWRRLGEPGGLKALEKRQGLSRPPSIDGMDGSVAVRLWREWDEQRALGSLRTLVEYNLYDAIQLRPLLELAHNRLVERNGLGHAPVPVFERGDVLYDVSKILAAL
jgi:uncharacterized protein YprB with RNaseH-like and TPR domain